MIKDLIKGWKLMPFGVSSTMNLVCMIFFAALGSVMEALIALGQVWGEFALGINSFVDLGAVFLFCAAMFPGQLVTSLDVSLLAQSSSYKRKLQTDITCLLTLFGNLAAMTVIVGIRLVVAALFPGQASAVLGTLPILGLVGFALVLYSGLAYKFFVISMVLLYLILLAAGVGFGFSGGMENVTAFWQNFSMPVPAGIIVSFVMITAGSGVQYLIARSAYKRPLSKYAFGAAMRKQM